MDKNVKGKTVVVTGAADGIGYGIAENFLKKNAKVVIILDVNETKGVDAARKLSSAYGTNKAVFIKCNIKHDLESVFKKIVESYKYFDVLVNNAGVLDEGSVENSVEVNITAVMKLSMKYWELVRKDKGGPGGTIINVSSIYGYRMNQYAPIYQGTKFAVLGFSRSLGHAYNYEKSGVRVLTICPGITETMMAMQLNIPDMKVKQDFADWLQTHAWQKPDALGRGTVQAFEEAESGTAWLIEGEKPIVELVLSYKDN